MVCAAIAVVDVGAQATPALPLVKEGFALLDHRQWAEATARFEACAPLARVQGDGLLEGECLRGLGRAAQGRRDFEAARRHYEAAHEVLAAAGHPGALGHNYNDRAFLAYVQSQWASVFELYGRAAEAFGAAGMKAEQATALRGQTFAQNVAFETKDRLLAQAWDLAREAQAPRVEARVLHHWGDMLFVQGSYDQALDKTERAVAILEQEGDTVSLALALTSLGRLQRAFGAPRQAIAIYRRVLSLQEKAGDIGGQAQTHNAIANAFLALDRGRDAVASFERALALAREGGNGGQVTFQIGSYANGLLSVGEHAGALAAVQQALDADQASDNLPIFLNVKARALHGLARLDEAEEVSTLAVEAARKLGSSEWEIDALMARAAILDGRARRAEALAALESAAAVIERERQRLPSADYFRRGYADKHQSLYARTVSLLQATGRARDAMALAEQARGRAFLDLLASRESSAPTAAPAPSATTVERVPARLGSTMVTYWVGDDDSIAWVVTPGGHVTSYRIAAGRTRLQRLVRRTWSLGPAALARRGLDAEDAGEPAPAPADRALASVTMRGGDPLGAGGQERQAYRELYDLLIRPLRGALPKGAGGLITIVPHGPLFELSFAALADPAGRFLLEDYQLHYAPSAATLGFTARRTTPATPASRFLFVANPATPPAGARTLVSLPGAEREVKAVSQLFAPGRSTTLIGSAATEPAITSAIGDYRVVHFATHGIVSSDNPLESFLALAPGAGGAADGRLTAAEITRLHLSADLVVLSACRAAGGRISGDGIIGLTRAFFTAGTPSIVAALWDMADESAEHLLPRFYAEWHKGNDKGRALRAAQLSMLRDLRAGKLTVQTPFGAMPLPPHPSLWANLVLIGEPR
jgi:CHAT domain-containing protein/tetratricopeptide (TPR) repeat protein